MKLDVLIPISLAVFMIVVSVHYAIVTYRLLTCPREGI